MVACHVASYLGRGVIGQALPCVPIARAWGLQPEATMRNRVRLPSLVSGLVGLLVGCVPVSVLLWHRGEGNSRVTKMLYNCTFYTCVAS